MNHDPVDAWRPFLLEGMLIRNFFQLHHTSIIHSFFVFFCSMNSWRGTIMLGCFLIWDGAASNGAGRTKLCLQHRLRFWGEITEKLNHLHHWSRVCGDGVNDPTFGNGVDVADCGLVQFLFEPSERNTTWGDWGLQHPWRLSKHGVISLNYIYTCVHLMIISE